MAIDISKLSYEVVLITSSGQQLQITELLQSLDWEENEDELAVRANLELMNTVYNGKKLSSWTSLGARIIIQADWGSGKQEVFRGTIWEWGFSLGSADILNLTIVDSMIYLQKSQDNRYYSAGTGSKTIITDILDSWSIPIGRYQGPNEIHVKKVFRNQYLSDMILEILDEVKKKGAGQFYLRDDRGKAQIIPVGNNEIIYHFSDENLLTISDNLTMDELVTRVKIVGKEDNDGRQPVEEVLTGKTEFGIIQAIYERDEDDSLDAAKKSAQEILNERGMPKRTSKIEAPDLPFLRKGDKIHVKAGSLNGYFYLTGVQHNGKAGSMTLQIKPI